MPPLLVSRASSERPYVTGAAPFIYAVVRTARRHDRRGGDGDDQPAAGADHVNGVLMVSPDNQGATLHVHRGRIIELEASSST
jgi:hypothetical protein